MHRLALIPFALTAIARAQSQSTVVPFFLLDTDPQSLVASVIDVQSATTTFELTCPSGSYLNLDETVS